MKIAHLVVALFFVLGLCFGPVAGAGNAASQASVAAQKSATLPAAKSISINKATKEELLTLPGIGPKTADAIIQYRTENKFSSLEEITKVKGIGEKTFAKIKEYLTL